MTVIIETLLFHSSPPDVDTKEVAVTLMRHRLAADMARAGEWMIRGAKVDSNAMSKLRVGIRFDFNIRAGDVGKSMMQISDCQSHDLFVSSGWCITMSYDGTRLAAAERQSRSHTRGSLRCWG